VLCASRGKQTETDGHDETKIRFAQFDERTYRMMEMQERNWDLRREETGQSRKLRHSVV
jgi:hypothetical protein